MCHFPCLNSFWRGLCSLTTQINLRPQNTFSREIFSSSSFQHPLAVSPHLFSRAAPCSSCSCECFCYHQWDPPKQSCLLNNPHQSFATGGHHTDLRNIPHEVAGFAMCFASGLRWDSEVNTQPWMPPVSWTAMRFPLAPEPVKISKFYFLCLGVGKHENKSIYFTSGHKTSNDSIPWQSVLRPTPIWVTSTRHLKAVFLHSASLPSLPLSSKPIQQLIHFGALKIFGFSHQPGPPQKNRQILPAWVMVFELPGTAPMISQMSPTSNLAVGLGKNEPICSRKRWTRSRNGSQIQHKVKSFLPHLESKYESLHSSDFKHHIHTYQPPGFILEFGHVWSSSNLSIRLSRVQPRCIEPWACEFMAKKGPRVRNVSRKEMVVGENRTLNITIYEHCNLQYQTKRWKLCQEVSFRKTEASISKMRTISVSNTAFSVMLPKSTKKKSKESFVYVGKMTTTDVKDVFLSVLERIFW